MEMLLLVAWLVLIVAVAMVPCLSVAALYDRIPKVAQHYNFVVRPFGIVRVELPFADEGRAWREGKPRQEALRVWFPYWLPIQAEVTDWTVINPYNRRVVKVCWPMLLGQRIDGRWDWSREVFPVDDFTYRAAD